MSDETYHTIGEERATPRSGCTADLFTTSEGVLEDACTETVPVRTIQGNKLSVSWPMMQRRIDKQRDTLRRRSRYGLLGLWFALIIPFSAASAEQAVQKEDDDRVVSQLGNIRGLVKPKSEARLSSEILARITALPFKEGQRFRAGEVLIRFDCSRYQAELASAKAELNARSKTHENNRELSRLNAIGKLEVEISEAEAEKAAAAVRAAGVNVGRCVITAPYPGRIVDRKVHEHETVAPEQELMTILDDRDLEIEIIVPSKWLTWLKVGTPFTFHADETDGDYLAQISELGARVDPVSQTLRVDGVFKTAAYDVLAGMSGTARFSAPQ